MRMYAIHDTAALAYHRPFFVETDQLAMRAFMEAVLADDRLRRYVADHSLWFLAEVDERNGQVDVPVSPMRVMTGHEIAARLGQPAVTHAPVERGDPLLSDVKASIDHVRALRKEGGVA